MSFFSRLFKAKQPETLEQKISALDAYDQPQLLTCLSVDGPEAYTCAVISRLKYDPALIRHAVDEQTSQNIKTAARKRIGELLDSNDLDVVTLSNSVDDHVSLLQICSYSSQAGVSLVEQISQEDLLLEVAQTGSTTQIRQVAAHKISGRSALEQLAKHSKTKDKSVFKIAKAKLAVFKEQKAIEQQIEQEINILCAQAEQLGKRQVDDIFHARKIQIENAWAGFAEQASPQARARFTAAIESCRHKIEAIHLREIAEAEQQAATEEAKNDVHNVLHVWQKLIARLYIDGTDEKTVSDIRRAQEQQENTFREAQAKGLNVDAEARTAERLRSTAQSLLEKINEYGPLEKLLNNLKNASEETGGEIRKRIQHLTTYAKSLTDVEVPPIVDASNQAVNEWSQQLKRQTDAMKEQLRSVAELIRRGDWAVSKGHVGRARAILRDLEDSIAKTGELPNHLAAKFEGFKQSIHKLGDWHEFAVTPKKEALVQQMQSLINNDAPPPQLADKIHKLQDQWKELCRGGQNQDEDLWQQFNAAAQEAYEPCKRYFEQQAQERERNAEQRKTLLTQLGEYNSAYDWDNADWKEVEKTLRIAREAWQSYWPVPRQDIKPLQSEFERLMDELYGKLKIEQERNRLQKEAIVAQAEKLLAHSDVQEAIESAKRLQGQWQKIGQSRRKDDQVLWKQFRAHCDAIFEKRNQENEALREEREQAKTKAINLLDQLEGFLSLEGEDYIGARAEIESVSADFKSIGELPKNDSKALFERYNHLIEALQTKTQQERVALAQESWRAVFDIADRLRLLEHHQVAGQDERDALAELQRTIADVPSWPGNTLDIISARLNNVPSLDEQRLKQAAQELRTLCIRSEIINSAETPAEDKNLRMQYQVELLQNDGLGRAATTVERDMQPLLEAWLSQPGCEDSLYRPLLQRFARCWNIRLT